MKNLTEKKESKFNFLNRFLTGMVVALALTLTAFEWTTVTTTRIDCNFLGPIVIDEDEDILPPIRFRTEEVEPPKVKKPSPEITIVKNITPPDIVEKPVDVEPTKKKDNGFSKFDPTLFGPVEDTFPDEDIIHTKVEIFAHYESCAHLNGDDLMNCSLIELSNRIKTEFRISEKLKDIGGRQAVLMSFVVDKDGSINSIEPVMSSSDAVTEDAIKAIKKLPKLNPAMQQGRAVPLRLKIPIRVEIKD